MSTPTAAGLVQIVLFYLVILALVKPLGSYMADVYEGTSVVVRLGASIERTLYRWAGVDAEREDDWKGYACALLSFNLVGFLVVYALQRTQALLPLNPSAMAAVSPDSSFNTATSFVSNTNWQGYAGETTMSYLTQMLGLGVQNFVSAATGMAVLVALCRAISRKSTDRIGNFWIDMVRSTLYILLPISWVVALLLVSQGVVQTFDAAAHVPLLQPATTDKGAQILEQVIALGPAASQVAIKQLGTNGGGFFNVNSAHPLENPTPFSNFVQLVSILLVPAALCHTFGRLIKDTRQGWALLAVMGVIFTAMLGVCVVSETQGNPGLLSLGVDQSVVGGNMEGKETRFGVVSSALWAVTTTAASNGSVNAMHDSFTPLGGLAPLWLIQLGEIVFGGVGSGLYGMIVFAIISVFIAGLMVGRTPEYLGKKIEAFEMKMASLVILIPAAFVLVGTALAVSVESGKSGVANPGAHGFTEILYAVSSAANNNGSAFAGLSANTPFYNLLLGVAMLAGRYWVALPVLAMAGSLAKKKVVPASPGTLPTHTPLFIALLVGTIVLVGALTFLPALALGPIVERLMGLSWRRKTR